LQKVPLSETFCKLDLTSERPEMDGLNASRETRHTDGFPKTAMIGALWDRWAARDGERFGRADRQQNGT
jgi:hypothetical protein